MICVKLIYSNGKQNLQTDEPFVTLNLYVSQLSKSWKLIFYQWIINMFLFRLTRSIKDNIVVNVHSSAIGRLAVKCLQLVMVWNLTIEHIQMKGLTNVLMISVQKLSRQVVISKNILELILVRVFWFRITNVYKSL